MKCTGRIARANAFEVTFGVMFILRSSRCKEPSNVWAVHLGVGYFTLYRDTVQRPKHKEDIKIRVIQYNERPKHKEAFYRNPNQLVCNHTLACGVRHCGYYAFLCTAPAPNAHCK